jgi:hypothetical protein
MLINESPSGMTARKAIALIVIYALIGLGVMLA